MEVEVDCLIEVEAEAVEACNRVAVESVHASVITTQPVLVNEDHVSLRGDIENAVQQLSLCLRPRCLVPANTTSSSGTYLPEKHCCFKNCTWTWKGIDAEHQTHGIPDVIEAGNVELARHLQASAEDDGHADAFANAMTHVDQRLPAEVLPSCVELYSEVSH